MGLNTQQSPRRCWKHMGQGAEGWNWDHRHHFHRPLGEDVRLVSAKLGSAVRSLGSKRVTLPPGNIVRIPLNYDNHLGSSLGR